MLILQLSFVSAFTIPPDVPLKAGMVIRKSVSIKPGIYKLAAANTNQEVITIEGNNISVDFKGAVLQGFLKAVTPDQYAGIAIRLKGNNITLKNAVIKGYKVGIMAADCESISISGCDLSYNYKPRLHSTSGQEEVSARMNYPANEKDEWLQYGAGIYLKNCPQAQVNNCTVTGGQNGLMLAGCDEGQFWNNNFSFLSGVGIGMYHCNRNKIMHNKLDWCVRGHNQNANQQRLAAASILVYEQSSENTFAYNSATHSGNGLLLWAGKSAIATGEGGCNDNLIYGNDFSYALFSGIESTFSSNRLIHNRIEGCTQGIWGSYTYNSLLLSNQFSNNKVGITIEHGQENAVVCNSFDKDTTAISLYAQKSGIRSRDYIIANNTFKNSPIPIQLTATDTVLIENNSFHQFAVLAKTDSSVHGIELINNNLYAYLPAQVQSLPVAKKLADGKNYLAIPVKKIASAPVPFTDSTGQEIVATILEEDAPDSLQGAISTSLPATHPKGRQYILSDEWGPYDFNYPVLWPQTGGENQTCAFQVLGPAGKWKVKKLKGVTLSASSGEVPGSITAKFTSESLMGVEIELEYTGAAIIAPSGESIEAGKAYFFYFKQLNLPVSRSAK